jgi:putative aldouronate transport system substrate-binding protein
MKNGGCKKMAQKKSLQWLSVFCTLAIAGSVLAGCGDKDNGAAEGSSAAPSATTQGPVKITIMGNLQTTEVPSDKVEKFIEEKTNSQLEIQWVPDGSYDEKFQAAFATGTLPQAVYLKNAASFILMRDAIRNGQFWEVGPLLKDYPNLAKLDQKVLSNTKVDGKIYSLYQERQPARSGLIFRKDWLEKVNMSVPTTTDELYKVLKAFKDADLAGNGKTIPLADRNDLVYGSFKTVATMFGTPNGWGLVDNKLTPDFMTKGYMDTLKFYKKLHQEGLINQDFPVTSKTDQQNLMYTGRSGVYIGTMGDGKTMQEKTEKNFPNAVFDVSNDLKGPDGKQTTWGTSGYGTMLMFPKTSVKSEAELKGILSVFDKFWSTEVADALKFGIKDAHYTLDKDNKVVSSTDTKLIEKEVRPYLNLALAETTNVSPQFYSSPILEKANKLSNEAAKFMIVDPTASLDSATYTERGARLQEQVKDATYQYIMGKIDDAGYKSATDKWLKDGGQKIIDEFNESYAKSK